ncbi:MAG: flippase-like domain-containing protein [Anaerolineales bacterium]|nr:flippase-like domain-containing protein [Anaerolineales bacterium]
MNPADRRRRWLRFLPGLLVSVLAVAALALAVDWSKTVDAWRQAQLWVLAPAMALAAGAMLTRAAAWRCLMGDAVPLGRCFWVLNISYLMNGILGFRIGDVIRPYLISRGRDGAPAKVTAGAALSAVALERSFDLAFTCVLVLCIFPWIAGMEWGGAVLLSAAGMAAAVFGGLFLLASSRSRLTALAARAAERFPRIRPLLEPLDHFLIGLAEIRNLRRSVPAFLWIILTMVLWGAVYWVVLRGFFPDASVFWGLLSLIGGLIGVALPSSPSSLGVFEGSVTVVLTMSGLARDTAVAYAIAVHMLNIAWLSALGALGLIVERQSLGSILAAAKTG